MKLEKKVAIVTGGGGGIGEGISRCLAKEGAHVMVADHQPSMARNVAESICRSGLGATARQVDITSEIQVNALVEETVAEMGRLDILVCCAGFSGFTAKALERESPHLVENLLLEDWDKTFDVNIKGLFLCNKAVVPIFKQQTSGKIVNISSMAGRKGESLLLAYSATKFAVIGFSQGLAAQLAPHHINVNVICPGMVYSPMWQEGGKVMVHANPGLKQRGIDPKQALDLAMKRQIPFQRYQTAEDIGKAAVFLCSDDASEITGQALNVCGGMHFN